MIRHISASDYTKGYMDLINTFTRNPTPSSYDEFKEALARVYTQNAEIYVIEEKGKVVSSIHLLFEQKLHNNFKSVCHIEDLVTDPAYRSLGFASLLLQHALQRSSEKNCYKVILSANPETVPFYLKNGFTVKGSELCKYL